MARESKEGEGGGAGGGMRDPGKEATHEEVIVPCACHCERLGLRRERWRRPRSGSEAVGLKETQMFV